MFESVTIICKRVLATSALIKHIIKLEKIIFCEDVHTNKTSVLNADN